MTSISFGIVSALGGACILLFALRSVRIAHSQFGWIKSSGTILTSEVRFDFELYSPVVTYEYFHNGAQLRNRKLRSELLQYNWRAPSQKIIDRYPPGLAVTVYVNPNNPTQSVLEPGGDSVTFKIAFAMGGILLATGLIGLIVGVSR
jgi:hypothetical protein